MLINRSDVGHYCKSKNPTSLSFTENIKCQWFFTFLFRELKKEIKRTESVNSFVI